MNPSAVTPCIPRFASWEARFHLAGLASEQMKQEDAGAPGRSEPGTVTRRDRAALCLAPTSHVAMNTATLPSSVLIRVTVKAKSHMDGVGVLAVSMPGPHHARRCSELLLWIYSHHQHHPGSRFQHLCFSDEEKELQSVLLAQGQASSK